MIKRFVIFTFILSMVAMLAMAPLNGSKVSENTQKLQSTIAVTIAVVTSPPPGTTPAAIPVTGGVPMSTLLIVALVAILGVAVILGGAALLSRRQE